MTIQLWKQKVMHWKRRAALPQAITWGSSWNSATIWGAKAKPTTLTASKNAAEVFTQNQNPSWTRW